MACRTTRKVRDRATYAPRMNRPGLTRGLGGPGEALEQATHPGKIIDLLGMPLHGNQEASLGRFDGFDDVVGFSGYAQLGRYGLDGLVMQAVDLDLRLIDQLRQPGVWIEADAMHQRGARPAVGIGVFDRRHALVSKILPEAATQRHVQHLLAAADAE